MRAIRAAVLVVLALSAIGIAHAEKKGRKVDAIWVAPDFAALGIESIAMFPVTSYDNSLPAEKLAGGLWAQALQPAGYRWVSTATTGEMLSRSGGDSLVKSVRAALLRQPRVDSLLAPSLCAKLRTDAILTLRVDRWEQLQIEWNQAGKPSTTVQFQATLVDSSGRLLWSANGSETGEGPYHDPSTNPLGVTSGGLGTQPITGQGGPPAFADVATRLFTRWAAQFPARAKPATASQ